MTDDGAVQPTPRAGAARQSGGSSRDPRQPIVPTRPPLWRDVRVIGWFAQLVVAVVVVLVVAWLWRNLQTNTRRQNIRINFNYLDQPAGFPIPSNSQFRQTQPVKDALIEAFQNTLRLAGAGLVLATILGIVLGIARLSQNFLVRTASRVYVEFVRNVPLVMLLTLMYIAVVLQLFPAPAKTWDLGPFAIVNVRGFSTSWFTSRPLVLVACLAIVLLVGFVASRLLNRYVDAGGNRTVRTPLLILVVVATAVVAWFAFGVDVTTPARQGLRVQGGITMTPEYFAGLVALVVYTSSHIAEIVRGSIQAVNRGQREAGEALALSGVQRMRFVILPQAMRIAIPAVGNQYLNLVKNSSLAAAISYAEITHITRLSVANRSPAIPSFVLLLGIYLVLSLAIATVMNFYNRRLAIVER